MFSRPWLKMKGCICVEETKKKVGKYILSRHTEFKWLRPTQSSSNFCPYLVTVSLPLFSTGRPSLLPVIGHPGSSISVWKLDPNTLSFPMFKGLLPYDKVNLWDMQLKCNVLLPYFCNLGWFFFGQIILAW